MCLRICPCYELEGTVSLTGRPNLKSDVLLIQHLCKIVAVRFSVAQWNSQSFDHFELKGYPATDGIYSKQTENWMRAILYVMLRETMLAQRAPTQGGGWEWDVKLHLRPSGGNRPWSYLEELNWVAQNVNLAQFLALEEKLKTGTVVLGTIWDS